MAWWSLQIEIVFYFFIPLVILVYPKLPHNNHGLYIFLIFLLLIGIVVQIEVEKAFPGYYTTDRMVLNIFKLIDYPICFLLGIYIAGRDFNNYQAFLFMIIGFTFIFLSKIFLPLCHTGFGFLYSGLIIFSFNDIKIKKWLSNRCLVWLGERSYSIFLIHFSVFYLVNYIVSFFTSDRTLTYGILTRLIGIPMAILFAMCLFYFVERRQARGLATGSHFWPKFRKEDDQEGEKSLLK
jgi:peptidoglycan/LPS O-acetylase OafA/YrhL